MRTIAIVFAFVLLKNSSVAGKVDVCDITADLRLLSLVLSDLFCNAFLL